MSSTTDSSEGGATLVSGATGLVGRRLVAALENPRAFSRNPVRASKKLGGVPAFAWSPTEAPPDCEAFEGVTAVVHLAGEPIAEGRWTEDKKRRILESRVLGTRNLVDAIAELEERPKVLVCASAVGFYGDRGDEELDESSAPGEGFVADVCRQWEAEARRAIALGVHVVSVRLGLVLAPEGGALEKMRLPFKAGAGGRLGSGEQWMPWVHIDDVVGVIRHAASGRESGHVLNAVSPNPVRNAEFTAALGRAYSRPTILPVPRFALRAALGEMSQILLASQRAIPRATLASGYTFGHTDLDEALQSVEAARTRL